MAVFVAVGPAEGKLLTIFEDIGTVHVIRKIPDIDLCGDELHGDVVRDVVDTDGGIPADLAGNAVIEAFLEPFARLRLPGMVGRLKIPVHRSGIDAAVEGGVVGTHVVPEHAVELIQRGYTREVQRIEPPLLEGSEMAFHLALAGAVADAGMEKDNAETDTDHGKLLIGIAGAVIDIKFIRNSISGNGLLQDLLEVVIRNYL